MSTINLFIDTDMGYDDLMALCLLFTNPQINIIGISVIDGVASIQNGIYNLQRFLQLTGRSEIPVYADLGKRNVNPPVQFPMKDRRRANNLTLLSCLPFPQDVKDNAIYPLTDIAKNIRELSKEITFLCLGPLTNMPRLFMSYQVKQYISNIYIMGGAINVPGNVPPTQISEYNFAIDPKSANQVFSSGIPISLVSLDTTKTVPAKPSSATPLQKRQLETFLKKVEVVNPSSLTGCILKSIIVNNDTDLDYYYDPVAAVCITNPTIIQDSKLINISITSTGQSVLTQKVPNNCRLLQTVNSQQFYQLLLAQLI